MLSTLGGLHLKQTPKVEHRELCKQTAAAGRSNITLATDVRFCLARYKTNSKELANSGARLQQRLSINDICLSSAVQLYGCIMLQFGMRRYQLYHA